jgi:cation transport ATPase
MQYRGKVEYSRERKLRERNTPLYRLCHWPIWILVFFLTPGPLTFSLFAGGFQWGNLIWLALVLIGTGIALARGQVPGGEPRPYILRFDEDRPNPLYRRVCYTFAWNAALNFALLNLAGLIIAAATGTWYMKQIYGFAYFPLCAVILFLGASGWLPRVGSSTKGEGHERRYFYGTVWSVTIAQTVLLLLWKILPHTSISVETGNWIKLAAYLAALLFMAWLSYRGKLHRTRPILPGDIMVAD